MLVNPDTLPWESPDNAMHGGPAIHGATTGGVKMATSQKSKPKGFGIFGRDKADK
jgi:hypothetical protein